MPAPTKMTSKASFIGRLAHQPVTVRAPDRLALREARETERVHVVLRLLAVRDQLRRHVADRRRELEAVAGESGGDVEALRPRLVDDRMPVGRDVEAARVRLV